MYVSISLLGKWFNAGMDLLGGGGAGGGYYFSW
jgi:hypothetical protein